MKITNLKTLVDVMWEVATDFVTATLTYMKSVGLDTADYGKALIDIPSKAIAKATDAATDITNSTK